MNNAGEARAIEERSTAAARSALSAVAESAAKALLASAETAAALCRKKVDEEKAEAENVAIEDVIAKVRVMDDTQGDANDTKGPEMAGSGKTVSPAP